MHESSVIQHFTEQAFERAFEQAFAQGFAQGFKQGEIKGTFEALLDVLDRRFQSSEVQELRPTLESIKELQTLKHLLGEAVEVGNLDEFRRILSSNGI